LYFLIKKILIFRFRKIERRSFKSTKHDKKMAFGESFMMLNLRKFDVIIDMT